ncbi:MAG: sigma-70 family RNA polymerase sigma factor [Planctomycetes bacterium]|nr:sigma-70 family RNA polymerase sigma factor [Planctomycetota bacterium]
MPERDDVELLGAIAARRDSEAFAALLQRYETPAYNLALRLTQNPESAEEVVQEAMLRVWRFADTFRPDGNARGWILQIVARKSLEHLKKARRRAKDKDIDAMQAPDRRSEPPSRGLERGEMLAALRREVARLSSDDQQLVTLYFAGEMTQMEIAETLAMGQTTVSGRLRTILERLRTALAQAGLAAALPLLDGGGLGEALRGGANPPSGLRERILQRAARGARVSGRAVPAAGASSAVFYAVAVLMVLGAGSYWVLKQPAEAPQRANAQPEPPQQQAGAPETKPFSRVWDFTQGAAKDLVVTEGTWTWVPPKDGLPGRMEPEESTWIRLSGTVPAHAMKVVVTGSLLLRQKPFSYGVNWTKGRTVLPCLNRQPTGNLPGVNNMSVTITHYLWDRYIIGTVGGRNLYLNVYEKPYPSDELCVSYINVAVQRIELTQIDESEIPDRFRDIEALVAEEKMDQVLRKQTEMDPDTPLRLDEVWAPVKK